MICWLSVRPDGTGKENGYGQKNVREDRNAYALFRKSFVASFPGRLDVRVTADSFYTLHVDGHFVGRGPARAPLAYYLFDTYAVDFAPGDHCLAVIVHHVGEVNATMMKGRPGLLANVTLTAGGRTCDFSSNASWRGMTAKAWKKDLPCLMSHFGFWEELDLRLIPAGWTSPDCPGETWAQSVELGDPPCEPWRRLLPRDIPLPRRATVDVRRIVASGQWTPGPTDSEGVLSRTIRQRVRIRNDFVSAMPCRLEAGTSNNGLFLTVDFGRTVSGFLVLDVAAAASGQAIDVSFDEILAEDGAVNPERTYAHLSDRYILGETPVEVRSTHPRGFRYVTLDISPSTTPLWLRRVYAMEETYPFEPRGGFTASDPDLGSFYVKSGETLRICTTDAFTDCPTRERVQWMEDLYMHSLSAMYAFGDTAMVRHALFQSAQCALPDGRINGFFPSERANCAFASSSLMWLAVLSEYWRFTGDEDDVRRLLPTGAALLRFLETQEDGDGLLAAWPAAQFWDWAPIESQGCLLITNAAYAHALGALASEFIFQDMLPPRPDENCSACGATRMPASGSRRRARTPTRDGRTQPAPCAVRMPMPWLSSAESVRRPTGRPCCGKSSSRRNWGRCPSGNTV